MFNDEKMKMDAEQSENDHQKAQRAQVARHVSEELDQHFHQFLVGQQFEHSIQDNIVTIRRKVTKKEFEIVCLSQDRFLIKVDDEPAAGEGNQNQMVRAVLSWLDK